MTASPAPARVPFEAARLGRHPALRAIALVAGAGIAAVVVAAAAITVAATLVMATDRTTRAFEGPVRRVVIRVDGGVEVSPGPDGRAEVERRSDYSFRRPTVATALTDGILEVRVRCEGPMLICDNRVHVTVPLDAEVDVRGTTVHLADLAGPVRVDASPGMVVLERLSGPVVVDIGAGPVEGRALASDEVRVRSGAGPIELDLARPPTVVDAETGAGPVDVVLPPGRPYRVDAATGAGPARVEVATDPDSPHVVRARSGAGPVEVRSRLG